MARVLHDPDRAVRLKRRLTRRYGVAIVAFVGLLSVTAVVAHARVRSLEVALARIERLSAALSAVEQIQAALGRAVQKRDDVVALPTGRGWPLRADTGWPDPAVRSAADPDVEALVAAAGALRVADRAQVDRFDARAGELAARIEALSDEAHAEARLAVERLEQTAQLLGLAWLVLLMAELWFVFRPGIMLIGRHIDDYTRARQLERALRQARRTRMLGRMAGGMAHEFNNILMPIVGLSDLMRSNMDADHPDRELLDMIIEAGDRARRLVGRVRVLDRPLSYARADLATLIDGAIEAAGTPAPDDPIELGEPARGRVEVTVAPDARVLDTDAAALKQALVEVLRNALAASAPVGVVEVEVARSGDLDHHTDIRIIDHGYGMSRATREAAFDPFFTTRTSGHGVGLGLSVAQGIVSAHGGRIDLHSKEGICTIVTLRIPTDPGQPAGEET